MAIGDQKESYAQSLVPHFKMPLIFVHLLTTSLNAWTKTSTFHVAGPGVSSLSPNLSNETELFP